jgi:hypothetical protein
MNSSPSPKSLRVVGRTDCKPAHWLCMVTSAKSRMRKLAEAGERLHARARAVETSRSERKNIPPSTGSAVAIARSRWECVVDWKSPNLSSTHHARKAACRPARSSAALSLKARRRPPIDNRLQEVRIVVAPRPACHICGHLGPALGRERAANPLDVARHRNDGRGRK